jgi:hypothetical protein
MKTPVRVPATLKLAADLAPRLRPADVAEVLAASGKDPHSAMALAVMYSRVAHAWLLDGRVEAISGTCDVPGRPDMGAVWALCSPVIDRHPAIFVRATDAYLRELIEPYEVLFNFVDNRNVKAIKWLSWLGFQLEDPEPYGAAQLPFRKFWIAKHGDTSVTRHDTMQSDRVEVSNV